MPLITTETIWNELQSLKQELKAVKKENIVQSLEVLSMDKVCKKILHRGRDTVMQLVKTGQLEATIEEKENGDIKYSFTVKAINDYLKANTYNPSSLHDDEIESTESIANRIFKKKAG